MSERQWKKTIRRGALAGILTILPWAIAAVGWTAAWNPYVCLIFTLGGLVMIITFLFATGWRHLPND